MSAKRPPGEPGFEWYVAWRYLHRTEPTRASKALMTWGAATFVLGALLLMAPRFLHMSAVWDNYLGRAPRRDVLELTGMLVVMFPLPPLGVSALFAGWLARRFSIFCTISMYGVYLGVAAPIIVLSVMSGFETDLKQKILGQHSHVVVTAPDRAWTGWEAALGKVRATPGVRAVSPYLESEVMIQSATMNNGIEFRGIDPKAIGGVTDLARDMEVGSLDNLLHPESIQATLPPLFEPPGEDEPGAGGGKRPAPPKETGPPAEPEGHRAGRTGTPGKAIERPPGDRPPAAPTPPGIVVGVELARNLRVYPGDDVTVACLACGVGPTGPIPNQRQFRVAGLFKTGMYEFDTKIAYTTLPVAQKFLSVPGEITGIEIKATDLDRAEKVADRVRAALGSGYDVKDWRELNRSLFSALKMEKVAMFIVLAFIVLVASFSIVSNLIMVVVEKGREIAILKSMGASDAGVMRIFLLEGIYIGIIGLLAGLATGLGACALLYRFGVSLDSEVYYIARLPVHVDLFELFAIVLCALGISCLATVYPALRAARLRPVEGLRYE